MKEAVRIAEQHWSILHTMPEKAFEEKETTGSSLPIVPIAIAAVVLVVVIILVTSKNKSNKKKNATENEEEHKNS